MNMKLSAAATVLAASLVSGCASQGGPRQAVTDGVNTVAKGVESVVGSVFKPYINGVQVTQQQLNQLEEGMSTSEVEQIIGFPPEIAAVGDQEVWSYPYTEINHWSSNVNETTVVRFSSAGKLVKAYKTNTRTSSTGNALVDAANGVN